MAKTKAKATKAKSKAFPEVPVKDAEAKRLLTATSARLMDLMHGTDPDIAIDAICGTVMVGVMFMKIGGADDKDIIALASDTITDIDNAMGVLGLIEKLGLHDQFGLPPSKSKAAGAHAGTA